MGLDLDNLGSAPDIENFDASKMALVWDVTLRADADVLMTDNETPVDGSVLFFNNWFPRKGDDVTRTKNGKMTKHQSKVNMLHDFAIGMNIIMSPKEAIIEAVTNAEWIGLEVVVDVEIREYEGRLSNSIKSMKAA